MSRGAAPNGPTRKLISHLQVTLDGYVCGPNGELDFSGEYHDEAMWADVTALTETVDTVLFGRVTYELFEAYWPGAASDPKSTEGDVAFSRWIEKTAKVVVSRTLAATRWNGATLLRGDVATGVAELKNRQGQDILIFGSPGLTSSLLGLGLVDELRVNVHPVVLGAGKRIYEGLTGAPPRLVLRGARPINEGVVGLRYERV